MRIPIDRQNSIPIYLQIQKALQQAILSGNLPAGTRLPATRQLAADLGVNRITVENAYAGLEAEGLAASQVGSGTYVLPPPPELLPACESRPVTLPLWQQDLILNEPRSAGLEPSLFTPTSPHPDMINLGSGGGDPALFPADEFRKVLQEVMRRDGISALEYGDVRGYAPLRTMIAHLLASQGLQTNAESILITSGSQQALALVTQYLLRPGDVVLVENPTYSGALDLFQSLHLKTVGIPVDSNGMMVEQLEKILQQFHPSLIYTIPNFHNPTGTCMSSPRRRQLLALAEQYNIPVLEDDYVGDLRYDGRAQPALKALDPGGRVIYISTFSKMLMPGLRIGFLAAEGPFLNGLTQFKRLNDLASSNLLQRAVEQFVTVGRYQAHLRRSSLLYRKRRDALLNGIQQWFPPDIKVVPPQGGLFVWLRLPGEINPHKLLQTAGEEGVLYAPGESFFLKPQEGESFIRLSFACQSPERLQEGARRLARAISRLTAKGSV